MRYIDDVLYLLGWVFLSIYAFSYGWQIGLIALAGLCWMTAVIWAKASAKFAKKSRDEPNRRDML